MTSILLKNYDLFIFDCDGVLMDTNMLKCDAFGKAVEGYPDKVVNNFVENCKNNFGISRYVKFKQFFSDFANEAYDEKKYNTYLERYASICKGIYRDANITPGTIDLLRKLKSSNKLLFVASGSDEKELNESFKERGLNNYFKGIYGSPKTKIECVSEIIKKSPGLKMVFIGDSISDLKSAKYFNLDFIFMSKYSVQTFDRNETCRKESILEIKELSDLLSYLG
ncbi:HAD family hydrolase [Cytobacillus firmus]|uniref:HAD family hydrolase n=1 Tax=Cytobacillus firmus TaxID=1399 RepID=UPI003001DC92